MYLTEVLADIKKESAPPKTLHAEHLFKLNEAVFNLPEEDTVDPQLARNLFQTVKQIRQAYNSGKFDNSDSNFFYDYLALLGTMQNQHFFKQQETDRMLSWIKELVDDGPAGATSQGASEKPLVKELQAENEWLRKKLSKYEELEGAVEVIRSFDLDKRAAAKGKGKAAPVDEPPVQGKAKGKSKGKGKPAPVEEEYPVAAKGAKGKGKGQVVKGSGKGKGKVDDYEEPPPAALSKGKGKGKPVKGKGKVAEPEEEAPPQGPPLRKAKGKGATSSPPAPTAAAEPKGKGKGKSKGKAPPEEEDDDDVPPQRGATKGQGKATTGKGKGKASAGKPKGSNAESVWKAKNA